MNKTSWAWAVVTTALVMTTLLSACGGGGDDATPPATSEVPASASTSIGGFVSYLQALVVTMADTLEPVDTSNVTPPTDETSEPVSVD